MEHPALAKIAYDRHLGFNMDPFFKAPETEPDFMSLFGDPNESLDPELEEYLCESFMGEALKHPLVFHVPYFSGLAAHANKALRLKREALVEAEGEGNWHRYIFLHERPYRIEAFQQLCQNHDLVGRAYWELLADVWSDSENLWQNQEDFDILISMAPHDGREFFMTDEEREHFATLPDTLTIYRGFHDDGTAEGWSWTLNKERAEWFAKRLRMDPKTGTVAVATVSKDDVIGYLNGRGEDEIVVDPDYVLVDHFEEIE